LIIITIFTTLFSSEVGITLINDAFFKTDKDYTGSNNIYYQFSSIPLKVLYQIDVYTPEHTYDKLPSPPLNSHPYAGFGYFGLEYINFFNYLTVTLKPKLGFTGQASNASRLQDAIHTIISVDKFNGWSTQIEQKLIYQLDFRVDKNFNLNYINILPFIYFEVGNLKNRESIGLEISKDYYYFTFTSQYKLIHTSSNLLLSGFDNSYKYAVVPNNYINEFIYGIELKHNNTGLIIKNHYQSKEYTTQNRAHKYTTIINYLKF